jgi:thioesterase domain-containing protein
LPDYMIPDVFHAVDPAVWAPDDLRHGLVPASDKSENRFVTAPSSELEAWLVAVWEDMLGTQPIGTTDNFFDLGGHSLLAARLCARIEQETGKTLHVATLFQSPTIGELAGRLEAVASAPERLLVPVRTQGSETPYFCVPGAGDNPFIFADLARHLSVDRPVYSFRFPDADGFTNVRGRELIALIARRFLSEVRAIQPAGPYLLGGYCFGGSVAFEMARELHEAGESVASLTIFETYLPGGFRMPHLRDRVAHQLRHMKTLPWHEQMSFVARMTSRRLARMSRQWLPALGSTIVPPTSDDDFTPVGLFPGTLTLFRGRQAMPGLIVDREMGWRGLARTIVVHEIDGHHTDAYKEPQVSQWIDALRESLAQAEREHRPAAAISDGPIG